MPISARYFKDMQPAIAGMISDTSAYNIDAACALSGNVDVLVGVAVQLDSVEAYQGHKVIKPMAASGVAFGVSVRSHYQLQNNKNDNQAYYEAGGAINVMTAGRIWVLSKDTTAPAFGAAVKFDVDGKQKADGAIVTNWTYAGGFVKLKGKASDGSQDLQLVEIQLIQK